MEEDVLVGRLDHLEAGFAHVADGVEEADASARRSFVEEIPEGDEGPGAPDPRAAVHSRNARVWGMGIERRGGGV